MALRNIEQLLKTIRKRTGLKTQVYDWVMFFVKKFGLEENKDYLIRKKYNSRQFEYFITEEVEKRIYDYYTNLYKWDFDFNTDYICKKTENLVSVSVEMKNLAELNEILHIQDNHLLHSFASAYATSKLIDRENGRTLAELYAVAKPNTTDLIDVDAFSNYNYTDCDMLKHFYVAEKALINVVAECEMLGYRISPQMFLQLQTLFSKS